MDKMKKILTIILVLVCFAGFCQQNMTIKKLLVTDSTIMQKGLYFSDTSYINGVKPAVNLYGAVNLGQLIDSMASVNAYDSLVFSITDGYLRGYKDGLVLDSTTFDGRYLTIANAIDSFQVVRDTNAQQRADININLGKDTTGIFHLNRALLDAIDTNDTTWWGRAETDQIYAGDSVNIARLNRINTFSQLQILQQSGQILDGSDTAINANKVYDALTDGTFTASFDTAYINSLINSVGSSGLFGSLTPSYYPVAADTNLVVDGIIRQYLSDSTLPVSDSVFDERIITRLNSVKLSSTRIALSFVYDGTYTIQTDVFEKVGGQITKTSGNLNIGTNPAGISHLKLARLSDSTFVLHISHNTTSLSNFVYYDYSNGILSQTLTGYSSILGGDIAPLTDTTFLLAYAGGIKVGHANKTTKAITFPYTANTTPEFFIPSIAGMTNSTAIAQHDSIRHITIEIDNSITINSTYAGIYTNSSFEQMVKLSDTKAVYVTFNTYLFGSVIDISGTTLSISSQQKISNSTPYSAINYRDFVSAQSASQFTINYVVSNVGYSVVCDVSGSTITDATLYKFGDDVEYLSVEDFDADEFMLFYGNTTGVNNNVGMFKVGTITGSDIAFSTGGQTVSNRSIYIDGNASPETDNTYDLGDATHRWRNIYLVNTSGTTTTMDTINTTIFVSDTITTTTLRADTISTVTLVADTISSNILVSDSITVTTLIIDTTIVLDGMINITVPTVTGEASGNVTGSIQSGYTASTKTITLDEAITAQVATDTFFLIRNSEMLAVWRRYTAKTRSKITYYTYHPVMLNDYDIPLIPVAFLNYLTASVLEIHFEKDVLAQKWKNIKDTETSLLKRKYGRALSNTQKEGRFNPNARDASIRRMIGD